jgi:hypothetical protein
MAPIIGDLYSVVRQSQNATEAKFDAFLARDMTHAQ